MSSRGGSREWPLLQAALEGVEVFAKLKVPDGVIKDIPYVGMMFGLLKGALDFRDRALQAKLAAFLTDERLQTALAAEEMRARLNDSGEAERIGTQLFLVIEKVTDFAKPIIIAQIFAGFLEGKVEVEDFLQLTHIVDVAYTGDLRSFANAGGLTNSEALNARLASVGLTLATVDGSIGGGGTYYSITGLGETFLRCFSSTK
ncbi:hypothetical protein [Herbaspirillum aquaticum]|uniref:hypothetical protein n=1 Tax=Herbaspirillum aquaticum TaxID=568783 RepID=UPI0024DEF621|nr:hypothetical protein [Herbaspirillum aquaticum]